MIRGSSPWPTPGQTPTAHSSSSWSLIRRPMLCNRSIRSLARLRRDWMSSAKNRGWRRDDQGDDRRIRSNFLEGYKKHPAMSGVFFADVGKWLMNLSHNHPSRLMTRHKKYSYNFPIRKLLARVYFGDHRFFGAWPRSEFDWAFEFVAPRRRRRSEPPTRSSFRQMDPGIF